MKKINQHGRLQLSNLNKKGGQYHVLQKDFRSSDMGIQKNVW
jgi:hypothetical protein